MFKSGYGFVNGLSTGAFSYSSSFGKQLGEDVLALRSFQAEVGKGTDATIAINSAMQNASVAAKNYALNTKITSSSIRDYIVSQRQSQVSNVALGSSFKSQISIIKTYNNNLHKIGLSQDQFREAVSKSNPTLGKYLSTVKSGDASTKGYIASLIGAKAASIGLRVATMALNMAFTALISIGVSAIFNAISESINAAKNRMDEAANSINDLSDSLKSLDDYREKTAKLREELDKGGLSLSDVTDKRKELYDIQKELIDRYGDEAKGIDIVTTSVEKQAEAYDKLNAKVLATWMSKNRNAVYDARENIYGEYRDKNYMTNGAHVSGLEGYGYAENAEAMGFTEWLENWISKNTNVEKHRAKTDNGVEYIITFDGSRKDILSNIDALDDAITAYIDGSNDLYEQERINAQAILNALTSERSSVADDYYNEAKKTYEEATQIVAQTKGVYKNYYKELNTLNKQYNDAVTKNDEEAASKAYKAIVDKYNEIVNNGTFTDTDNVRGEDIKAYFENQLQDFMNLSVPVRLKVDIEGTKREFDSSYEKLAEIYAKVGDEGFNFGEDSFDILEHYNEVLKEAKELGVDLNQTVFGNIDTNNRQLLEWTEENLNKYKDAYESLGWTAEELKGSISTVMGMADEFDGVSIAFTPMLQTDHGAVLLDENTVYEYIWALIDQMPEGWTNEDLLKLDARGIEMDGQKIKGLIADIGDTAIKTSESMHFAGKDGAIADAYKYWQEYVKENNLSNISVDQASEFNAIRDAAKEAGVSIESYIDALVQYGKVKKTTASPTEDLSISKYSEDIKKAQDAISPLLDAYNKLQKGELSNSDIVTLISDKFPSLIQYTNNLSVGIQKLAKEKLEELKTKLDAVDKSKLSESDLKAYEKFIEYIDSLNDGFSSTLAYCEKIQSQTKSVSDSISTLIGLSKEINENGGLSLSSMEKILSDDSLTSLRPYLNDVKSMLPIINNLIDDQKQAYEDLYNEQQRLADPDAYIEASQEKQKEDENAFQNAVKRINEQINKFKEKYGVDLKNWEHIEDGKKSILQNTNAELLSKQWKLINDFGEYYNTDLKNFKDITEAKAAILENFGKSKAFAQIRDILIEDDSLGNNYGQLYISDEKSKKKINSILSASGLTWQDYLQYMQGGTFTKESDNALKKVFNEIVNAYTISPSTWNDATKSIGASGGSSGSSSSSKGKTWFEQQYAYHNHLVNMEQEKQQDYLNWLDSAYKQAYSQGIIDLDAYYKYEEEVYNGRKKLAGDTSNWFDRQYKEHQHLLKMEKEDEADYLKWLDSAYKKAYAEGLITLDEYRKYQEEVYDGIKKLKDNAESAINNLINIRINMLKEEVNEEKESINKRLDMLKDFYQKQKDMLQDKYDKEKYLDEQNEKRKKVSDIQAEIAALQMDDSAKAQKRRAELAVDLKDAQKDLTDFEKEHSLKTAQDQLDTLYENQEKAAKKKIEDLEKKVSSPQELYEQALADIRNGSQQLYNQMIKWNNVYGDGIRDTIKNAWEEAYRAEKQYFNYTGKHFNGVNLSNATGYIKGKTGYASGTSYATSGLHRVDELGIETIFQSADGQRYRMFSSGEKVLNASASDFLYKFANKGREILEKLFNGTSHSYNNVNPGVVANNIQQGDIIIQGNADKATVSEIRRAQRDNLEQILKQFNKLK